MTASYYEPKPQTARLLLKPYFIHRQFPCCITATSSRIVNFLQRKINHLKPEVMSGEPNRAEQAHRRGSKLLKTPLARIETFPSTRSSAHLLSKTQRIALAYSFSIPANLTASPVIWHFKSSTSTFVRAGLQSVSTGPLQGLSNRRQKFKWPVQIPQNMLLKIQECRNGKKRRIPIT